MLFFWIGRLAVIHHFHHWQSHLILPPWFPFQGNDPKMVVRRHSRNIVRNDSENNCRIQRLYKDSTHISFLPMISNLLSEYNIHQVWMGCKNFVFLHPQSNFAWRNQGYHQKERKETAEKMLQSTLSEMQKHTDTKMISIA